MEPLLLAIQARVLMGIGVAWMALGLYLGQDPGTVAWRAALGALVGMWVVGKLIHRVGAIIEEKEREIEAERLAAEALAAAKAEEEAQKAAAAEAAKAQPKGAPAVSRPAAATAGVRR